MAQSVIRVIERKEVALSLRARPFRLAAGQSSTLSWRAENAQKCFAQGAWSGEMPVAGSFDTGPLSENARYTISCLNGTKETMQTIMLRVRGFALRWQPPSRNIDGSAATDIAGYRIYWGRAVDQYVGSYTIHSPSTTEWYPDLASGTYYFAISAFDVDGNESEKSAPIQQRIP